MKKSNLLITLIASVSFGQALAQTEISFWHGMDGPAEKTIEKFAVDFNKSQSAYKVIPKYVGQYREGETKLIAALRSGGAPVLFQAELTFFPKLASEGAIENLDSYAAGLAKSYMDDFYDSAWDYGMYGGHRVALPFNMSTPVLFINQNQLASKGLKVPSNWAEFGNMVQKLSTRTSKGYIAVTESWTFEAMVTSRGGNLVTADGKPDFASPKAVEALEFMQKLNKAKVISVRNLAQASFAQIDFIRTKASSVIGSISSWPIAEQNSFAFKLAVGPIPLEPGGKVPLGGAQLVVIKGASAEQTKGAFAFWKHLMEPENIKTWVESSYYVPVRKSSVPLLDDFFKANPYRRVAFNQVAVAQPRPKLPQFTTWKVFLEDALEKAMKGGVSARVALEEAQKKAESVK